MALHNRISGKLLKTQLNVNLQPRTTLSFYKYHTLADPKTFRDALYTAWHDLGVWGRIYVASEGINAQVSVPTASFARFKDHLDRIPFLAGVRLNTAIEDNGKSFFKLKIQVRQKIVADGLHDATFDPSDSGTHLSAAAYNRISDDADTVVVDMRNHYESEVGHFRNAVCPDVDTFREALPVVEKILSGKKEKAIVMYCTGGIRCEKASAWLKHRGFRHVFQLDGGIIEYARQVKASGLENKFIGKNFVFDERLGSESRKTSSAFATSVVRPATPTPIAGTKPVTSCSYNAPTVPTTIMAAARRNAGRSWHCRRHSNSTFAKAKRRAHASSGKAVLKISDSNPTGKRPERASQFLNVPLRGKPGIVAPYVSS